MVSKCSKLMELDKNILNIFNSPESYEIDKNFSTENNHAKIEEKLGFFPILKPCDITYSDFFKEYLLKNVPCLFTDEITSDWCSTKDWICTESSPSLDCDKDIKINFEFLRKLYGHATVNVTNCSDKTALEYGSGELKTMTLNEFLDYWEHYIQDGYPVSMPCLYLKDWHIVKDSKTYTPYITPEYFSSDWLNEVWDDNADTKDDFRFAYFGSKGSWTPLHSDVYGSFSWSANIIGTKLWYVYPPGKEKRFLTSHGDLIFDETNPGVRDVDFFEVYQTTGQIIFVPSGWHHVVWNLTDVISINHNWMNGANIKFIWSTLKNALQDVKTEISDLQGLPEFDDQCQLILKANHGMDYKMFFDAISSILLKRQNQNDPVSLLSPNHIEFDIAAIQDVVQNHVLKDKSALDIITSNKFKWSSFFEWSTSI